MKIINKINNYLFENDYKIVFTDNYINIQNYEEIINFSLNLIEIKINNKKVSIEGNNLTISKMIKNEVLIKGTVYNISIKNS